jgi:phosphomannomutase
MSSLKFGTSGLRGLVSELTDAVCFGYSTAFLEHLVAKGLTPGSKVLVGQDLRDSSARIADACMAAVDALGMDVENCSILPTPALALRAMTLKVPAIMVTGSHIPADRNGLKFYRPDGEIDKADESEIVRRVAGADRVGLIKDSKYPNEPAAIDSYIARSRSILMQDALSGKRIGVYQHSSVSRDLMLDIVAAFGAEAIALGRSDVFVPVDTEALRPEDVAFAKAAVAEHSLDALLSTDGDADRPMLFDETGNFVRGDLLGILTAKFLGADAVVTPVTSTSAIEQSGLFKTVVRTKVGSPFVIAGMEEARRQGGRIVVGFEANGGVLLGSDVSVAGGTLTALPTRDAMLPMLSVLGLGLKEGKPISELVAALPARFAMSGRLEHVGPEKTGPFLEKLQDAAFQASYFDGKGTIRAVDRIDGVRFVFESGDTVHYRASGNAPELRCYAETGDSTKSAALLDWGLAKAAATL